jgi:hypothetical protein
VRIAGWIPRASSRSSASDRASSVSAASSFVESSASPAAARAGEAQIHGQRQQPLLRSVVEVALEAPPFFILRGDQPLAGHLQLVHEGNVSQHEPGPKRSQYHP